MKAFISGSDKDNVITCCEAVEAGDIFQINGVSITAAQSIPIYHKMAIAAVSKGAYVYKYGQPIGIASADILPGQHVHIHNLESDRGRGDRKGGSAK